MKSAADPLPETQPVLPVPATADKNWGRLYGSAPGLALAELAQRSAGLVVVVAANMPELLRTEAELSFYRPDNLAIESFVEWETLPYDRVSPHQDIVAQRIRALYSLDRHQGILLITASALMQRVAPRSFLDQHALMINSGDTLVLDDFRTRLTEAGYRHVSQVEEHGEFTVRGSILDLYPMTSEHPYRLEFFDDEIESIRAFDAENQRSIEKRQSIELLPAHEFPLNPDGITRFRRAFRNTFAAESKNSPVYQAVSDGHAPTGIEYYAPLFFDAMATLFDYLPDDASFVLLDGAENGMQSFWESTEYRYEERRHDLERPILPPGDLYLTSDETRASIRRFSAINLASAERDPDAWPNHHNFPTEAPGLFPVNPRVEQPLGLLSDFIERFDGRVLFTAESTGRREALQDQLVGNGIRPVMVDGWSEFVQSGHSLAITVAPVDHGLTLPSANLAVVTEIQLGSGRVRHRERRRPTRDSDAIIANLTDLTIGDPVVHIDHGVGRYQGLTRLSVADIETEFLTLQYAGDDRLYVPVAALHLISRYSGSSPNSAPLHKLGSETWKRVKRRAAEKAHDVAAELLEIHARRAARKGHAFPADASNYDAFAAAFAFEETPDQAQAIEAVLADLRSEQPTDRVVCGDVGFGKTEVAMRAAFVAVDGGKQVAVLVPTTLLAQQHEQNFRDRFSDWPVQIESMSRFSTAREHKDVIQRLASGKVDIVIGTHRLLQKDIKYKNLGLVIIDEEHRFGVRHKEHMKALRSEVDIVTLTATPIPRTLNMGLSGLRDLSIIATAPAHRHAIKTFVGEWSDVQIREACERELARGGQVYFLHNEVNSIERITRTLEEIVPTAKVRFAHGQMREADLESVMYDFYHQRFNILVCTTIVESGIDVPSANTIIINRADKLGLAQLHQLRGRVGRSHHRAYAYLIAPPKGSITADAEKRLAAIESLEDLGVGFTLATHDLEIRGAGELLGDGQSGQIQEIGFTLYSQLLERAVEALKSGKLPDYDAPLAQATEVDLGAPALLPEIYVPDVHIRLILYKRISHAANPEELRELKVELIDRFGLLPPQTETLFSAMAIKQSCARLGIERVEMNAGGGRIVFEDKPNINTQALISMIQIRAAEFRFDGRKVLRLLSAVETPEERFDYLESLLKSLAPAGSSDS
ncbi:MAG: transcription-repair coupling factor [Gammaproteobacteria bacterium]|nr:transcription-repair coupling factor [Gammaproteobacteria bacterium]